MTLVIKGSDLTIKDVVNVARNNQKVKLHPDALDRIKKCRAMLERKIDAGEIMYGVNTGIGEFSEVVLDDDQIFDQWMKARQKVYLDEVTALLKKFNEKNDRLPVYKDKEMKIIRDGLNNKYFGNGIWTWTDLLKHVFGRTNVKLERSPYNLTEDEHQILQEMIQYYGENGVFPNNKDYFIIGKKKFTPKFI